MRPLRILTWHVHGSYLWYLSHVPHELYLPVRPGRPEGYGGRSAGFPWPHNVHDVPADQVRDLDLDAILFQSRRNWEVDQHEVLSEEQRRLPRLYVEHDPPRESPTDTRHPVDDPNVLLVHVTPFNALMWDSGRTPARVIDHGVTVPDGLVPTYELARGISVVNNIARRGRRLGPDVFERARAQVPLDLVGLNSADVGGLGDLPLESLPAFERRYRFFFNPIRYTSLGLAVCEAMMLGLPVVGLATTEMASAVENGVSGFVDTNVDRLVDRMHELLGDARLARELGAGARDRARERFGIERFVRDWDRAFRDAAGGGRALGPHSAGRRSAEAYPVPSAGRGPAGALSQRAGTRFVVPPTRPAPAVAAPSAISPSVASAASAFASASAASDAPAATGTTAATGARP